MANKHPHLSEDCRPVAHILSRIGDKWSILLLQTLESEPIRFKDLHRALPGISQRMLTVTLRNLERDGLLLRRIYPTIPPKVEYTLSPLGHSLKQVISPIGQWVQTHRDKILEAQAAFDLARAAPDP